MSSNKCARCELTVYPVEGLRCLDKLWHKGCFKCHECNMTLNMKNYKGFEKRPYCNAHCPQAKATTVADTPESRRLAENTRIQSQAKYHEDFEKSKGKGFTTIADDPETRRIKETSKIISNLAYHGELERKKQMEERRAIGGSDSIPLAKINNNSMLNNNNNNDKDQVDELNAKFTSQNNQHKNNHMSNNLSQNYDPDLVGLNRNPNEIVLNQQAVQEHQMLIQRQQQQQQQQQQQHLLTQQQQMQLLKQQQQHLYAQDQLDLQQQHHIVQHQTMNELVHQPHIGQKQQTQQQQYSASQQQQQLMIRQQQLLMQRQFPRQPLDSSMPINNRQVPKQVNNVLPHMIKNNNHRQQNISQQQQPAKYVAINEVVPNNSMPTHLIGNNSSARNIIPNPVNNHIVGSMHNNQRIIANHPAMVGPNQHHMVHVYNNQVGAMNGAMPKQHQQAQTQQQFIPISNQQQQRQMLLHPSQIQPINPSHAQHHHHHHQQQQQQQQQQMRPQTGMHQRFVQQPQQNFLHQPPRIYRAMYDYVANDVDEVSFFENDVLVDCVNVDRNWLIGKVARSGQTGMLPANYVTELPSQ